MQFKTLLTSPGQQRISTAMNWRHKVTFSWKHNEFLGKGCLRIICVRLRRHFDEPGETEIHISFSAFKFCLFHDKDKDCKIMCLLSWTSVLAMIKFPSEASRVWFVCKVDIYTTNLIFNCQTLINSLGNLYSDHCVKSVWRICFEVFKPENQLSNSSNRSGQVRTQFIPRDNLFMVPHQRTTIILTSTERSQKN